MGRAPGVDAADRGRGRGENGVRAFRPHREADTRAMPADPGLERTVLLTDSGARALRAWRCIGASVVRANLRDELAFFRRGAKLRPLSPRPAAMARRLSLRSAVGRGAGRLGRRRHCLDRGPARGRDRRGAPAGGRTSAPGVPSHRGLVGGLLLGADRAACRGNLARHGGGTSASRRRRAARARGRSDGRPLDGGTAPVRSSGAGRQMPPSDRGAGFCQSAAHRQQDRGR